MKTLTTSVAFTDPQGNVLANGVIIFQLNMGAKLITNGEIVNILKVPFTFTSGGMMPGGSQIIANDELMPTGTMYVVTIFNSNGLLVRGPENWILSGVSPIDLSTITSVGVPDPGLGSPVLQNPSAAQTITGQSLTLTSSAPLLAAVLEGCQHVNSTQSFATALAAVTNPGCIVIDPGTYTVSANAAVPSGVTLGIPGGGVLSIANGVTLTVSGPILAPPAQIFTYVGTGSVALGANATPPYANWFPGADINASVNAAYTALPAQGGRIKIAAGSYSVTTPITFSTLNKFPSLECEPGGATTLNWTPATGTHILLNWGTQSASPANQVVTWISGCTLIATSAGNTSIGIDANGPNGVSSCVIEKNTIKGYGTSNIQLTNSAAPSFLMSIRENFLGNTSGTSPVNCIFLNSPTENNRIMLNTMSACGHAIALGSSMTTGDYQIDYNSFDSNTIDMINIPATAGLTMRVSLRNNHYEDNTTGSCIALQMAGGSVGIDFATYVRDQATACTSAFNVTGGQLIYKDIIIQTNATITNAINCANAQCLGLSPHSVAGAGSVTNWLTTSGTGNVTELSPGLLRIQSTSNPVNINENGGSQLTIGLNGRSWVFQPTVSFPDTPQSISAGTSTLTANAALAAVTSQAAITTAATNTATTDAIEWNYATAPGAGDSLCHVSAYVTAGNVNFVRTNPTAAAQNVSAIVLNWRVIR